MLKDVFLVVQGLKVVHLVLQILAVFAKERDAILLKDVFLVLLDLQNAHLVQLPVV